MIYLAAPFFTPPQIELIGRLERMLDERNLRYFSPRKQGGVLDIAKKPDQAALLKVFASNIEGMRACDMMLAGVDYKDTGTTWEMGFWYGHNKRSSISPKLHHPLVTYSLNNSPANLMLSQSTNGHISSLGELERFIAHVDKAITTVGWNCYGTATDAFKFASSRETNE